MRRLVVIVSLLVSACEPTTADPPDSTEEPPPPPPPREARDIAVAAGRVTGGTLVVDVQIGASTGPQRSTGMTVTATTAAPLNP